jgi:hypothetical protein|uniref:Putative tail-component n=1 Tax=Siphoviridae sp. ctqwY3 TaxID=2827951 RepID=A0A8S5S6Q8_9CAUD|nr:MAG TPA: putative tail-component [Siphoviridae sp. ctqwY3]
MNISVATSVKWYPGKKQQIEQVSNKIMYEVARETLDVSFTHIPLSTNKNAGKLRQSSTSGGVKGGDGNYYIGSYTDYAKFVWAMGSGTNWSTSGTFGKWYEEVWKKQGKSILSSAIERNKLK